ncbi:MAG: pantothenate kinase [Flammeovirgaceae bacterium]|nr:pantothenate kinase [Flammeovirgaceae bacterium]MBE62213.1 pantothenate kinase [Flammeovirgaceae bacterium]MBR08945.1 pantothenate kinase [Rickettsiales bacterium]HCX24459.1 pantothenate kinase [Cytophagales bacterium]|tara:strand:- start:14329 stop:15048 length:720 start_codon:yes stop_codon:yes gene_type:complete
MPNVAVDIGNTRIKSALFEEEELISTATHTNLEELIAHYSANTHHWVFGSVKHYDEQIKKIFYKEKYLQLTHKTPLPIGVNYDTPETLGVDRLASAVGAYIKFPNRNRLIIDAGTCITYDLVDSEGYFQGGVIAPGLQMRMKAMAHYTDALPDISSNFSEIMLKNLGKSTHQCLLAGSLSAASHEMNGFIDHFLKEYDDLAVIMTGGDTIHFESKLKAPIFADFDLVLTGLNRILIKNQ